MKKSFSRSIFRDYFYIVLLAAQVFFMVYAAHTVGVRLYEVSPMFGLLTAIPVVCIVMSGSPAPVKLAWLSLICVFPAVGTALYLFVRTGLPTHRINSKKIEPTPDFSEVRGKFPQQSGLMSYLSGYCGFPVYPNESAEYFPLGEMQIHVMLDEMSKAERSIYMEYFLISDGAAFRAAADILIKKARAGADVRIICDGMGTGILSQHRILRMLSASGVRCRYYGAIAPIISPTLNNRDHRKLLIIDGKTAFIGGTNLADEYVNLLDRCGHWKDAALLIRGIAVRSCTEMFLSLWNGGSSPAPSVHTVPSTTDGYIQPFSSDPHCREKVARSVYLQLIGTASRSLTITSPYLAPDSEVIDALCLASKRGVDVRLIVPHVPDKKCAYLIALRSYPKLLDAGVKVFEYRFGFMHAKTLTADDSTAVIGSVNLDFRSFFHHHESAAVLYGCAVISDIIKDFSQTESDSIPISREYLCSLPVSERIFSRLLEPFAPMI